jgi:hypothetical protein
VADLAVRLPAEKLGLTRFFLTRFFRFFTSMRMPPN